MCDDDDAIILFSHGSILPGAGAQLEQHANRLRARMPGRIVEYGYLNYSEPRFEPVVERCAVLGAKRIVVTPYFLVPGKFVTHDLPLAIQRASTVHPDLEIITANVIGYDRRITHAIERLAIPSERDAAATHSLTTLVVIAHGSPRAMANEDIYRVVDDLKAGGRFGDVRLCFLECNEPSIPETLDAAADAGAATIITVPYFLHSGTHVEEDLPQLTREAESRHPKAGFLQAPFLGTSAIITDILADRAAAALPALAAA